MVHSPPFVVNGQRRLYPPDLCPIEILQMKQGIQKCFQNPGKKGDPNPTFWTPLPTGVGARNRTESSPMLPPPSSPTVASKG